MVKEVIVYQTANGSRADPTQEGVVSLAIRNNTEPKYVWGVYYRGMKLPESVLSDPTISVMSSEDAKREFKFRKADMRIVRP